MRSVRVEPSVYFGNPGSYVKMPWPRSGMDAPVIRPIFDFESGSGNHRTSTLIGTPRTYTLNWTALHQSTFDLVNQFYLGLNGPGPFVLIDPSRPNLLTPNQSAAGGAWYDTTDWLMPSTGTLAVNRSASFILRQFGKRSIQYTSVTGSGVGLIQLPSPYSSWAGHPVLPGSTYTFSYSGTPDGTVDSSISNVAQMLWYTAGGIFISTSAGSAGNLAGWQKYSVSAVAPPNAAYVLPTIQIDLSTMVVGSSFYVDMLQLEMDSRVNDWAPGTGINPVSIMSFNESMSFDALFRVGPSLTLQEVK